MLNTDYNEKNTFFKQKIPVVVNECRITETWDYIGIC